MSWGTYGPIMTPQGQPASRIRGEWQTIGVQLPLITLVGPTATGKSGLAVELATLLVDRGQPAEIVNADSMLVYRGMDIGTAKPSVEERAGITHHLLDILDVGQTASVAHFQQLARRTIADLRGRGVVPILVGGSALYTRAITDVFEFPASDEEVRARWESELERIGPFELHALLRERAPESAAQIEPGNGRRTVRALEVLELTGQHKPLIPQWSYELPAVSQFGLNLGRAELDRRIDERVDAMWERGLVDEVRGLLAVGLRDGVTARRAIGYRQVIDLLDGIVDEAEAKAAVKKATRRFFRKQLGWYRRDPRIQWLDAERDDNAATILGALDWESLRRNGDA